MKLKLSLLITLYTVCSMCALAQTGTDYTNRITSADCTSNDGWNNNNAPTTTMDAYTGKSRTVFAPQDQGNYAARYQTITLPAAGHYVLKTFIWINPVEGGYVQVVLGNDGTVPTEENWGSIVGSSLENTTTFESIRNLYKVGTSGDNTEFLNGNNDSWSANEIHFTANADESKTIYLNISQANAYVSGMKLIYLGDAAVTMKCSAGKYGTFCAPFDVEIPNGIDVYSATVDNAKKEVILTEKGGSTLSAGTPVIIYSEEGLAETTFYGKKTVTENKQAGSLVGILDASNLIVPANAYVLQTQNGVQAFYKVKDATPGALYRCYLDAGTSQAAQRLTITFGETFIENIKQAESAEAAEYYSVNGSKLQAPVKGINIVKMTDGSVKKITIK